MDFLILILLIINFGISWLNAWSVGRSWADSKAIGGWQRIVICSAAVMSAAGFTWCYLVIVSYIALFTGYLPPEYIRLTFEIGYVIIIFPVLGSGLAIWMDSVTTAWRNKSAASIGVAGWNTFAMAHNVYHASNALPGIFKHISNFAFGGNGTGQEKLVRIALALVFLALCGGVLTTWMIVRKTARKYSTALDLQTAVPESQ